MLGYTFTPDQTSPEVESDSCDNGLRSLGQKVKVDPVAIPQPKSDLKLKPRNARVIQKANNWTPGLVLPLPK